MGEYAAKSHRLKDGRKLTIRSARVEDAAEVLALAGENFRSSEFLLVEPDEFKMTLEKELDWIEEHRTHATNLLLLAIIEEAGASRIVGMIGFEGNLRRRIAHWGKLGMGIHEAYRGLGIGGHALEALFDWARATGTIERVELDVFAANEHALALYRKMGFIEEGRRQRALKLKDGQYFDEILMAKWV